MLTNEFGNNIVNSKPVNSTEESQTFTCNFKKLEEIQQQTIKEVRHLLKEHGRCGIVRPTGFGKTYIATQIAKDYGKVLYVYPTEAIKQDVAAKYELFTAGTVKPISYKLFGKIQQDPKLFHWLKSQNFNLIVFDEMHCMGANNVKVSFNKIQELARVENIALLGLSATPFRTDGYDVTQHCFDDVAPFAYDMDDAINDSILPPTHYVVGLVDIVDTMNSAVDWEETDSFRMKQFKEELSNTAVELSVKLNASYIIQKHIRLVYGFVPDYMKFIVFSSTWQNLDDNMPEIRKYFSEALPNKSLNILKVTSRFEDKSSLESLELLKTKPNTVDVIMCVDMLNMGYHINNITGVIMLRSTISSIIYHQQIGRCISIENKHLPIVFDFVNNFERSSVYRVYKETVQPTTKILVVQDEEVSVFYTSTVVIHDYIADPLAIVQKYKDIALKDLKRRAWEMHSNLGYDAVKIFVRLRKQVRENQIAQWVSEWNKEV